MEQYLVTWNNERYEWRGDYDSRFVPKTAGWRWDRERKVWFTVNHNDATQLYQYADKHAAKRMDNIVKIQEEVVKASRAYESDFDVPAPDGLEYLDFQKAGVEYATKHQHTLFGDEMGLGKTIEALGCVNLWKRQKYQVLVICPASLKINWQREATKWLVGEWQVDVVMPKDKFPERIHGKQVVIVNYDIVKRFESQLREEAWDVMIVDECHYLKNHKAQRTANILGKHIRNKDTGKWEGAPSPIPAGRKLFLSGTPMSNRPIELWTVAKACAPETFKNWKHYINHFCDAQHTRWGLDVTGASNLPELQELCRKHFMVRRLKRDVLTDLPPKRRQVVELPLNGAATAVRREMKAYHGHAAAIESLRAAVELAKASDDEQEYRDALEALRAGVAVAFSEMSAARRDTALAKVPWVIQRVEDALAEGPVVLFGHHKEVLHAVAKKFEGKCGMVTGDHSTKQRQFAVDGFQAGDFDLIIGTMGAMGVGLTLTRSSLAIFCELDWQPSVVSQSEDRIHRHGQQNSVLIQHLVLPGSLDAHMAETLVAKQEVLDAALDTESDFAGIKRMPVFPGLKAATDNLTREDLERAAQDPFPPTQMDAILFGLRKLAGVCDGAATEDGVGYNGLDTRIGKSLAEAGKLSPKQAVLGQRILFKYRRQLGDELWNVIAK